MVPPSLADAGYRCLRQQHRKILKAIKAHDADGAAKALRDHLTSLRERVALLQNSPVRNFLHLERPNPGLSKQNRRPDATCETAESPAFFNTSPPADLPNQRRESWDSRRKPMPYPGAFFASKTHHVKYHDMWRPGSPVVLARA